MSHQPHFSKKQLNVSSQYKLLDQSTMISPHNNNYSNNCLCIIDFAINGILPELSSTVQGTRRQQPSRGRCRLVRFVRRLRGAEMVLGGADDGGRVPREHGPVVHDGIGVLGEG